MGQHPPRTTQIIDVFKKNIQNQLLQVLKEENNYVGIPTLINKFQNVCPK